MPANAGKLHRLFAANAAKGGVWGGDSPPTNRGGVRGGGSPPANCESEHNCESESTAKASIIEIAT